MVAVPEMIVRRKLTLEDYRALPDDQDYEIVDGVLYVSPRARPRHQRIVNRIAHILTLQEERGAGVVVPDADLILDERNTYVSPDIMFFAGNRFAAVDPDEMIRIVPDLVIEVLSPTTADFDQSTKRDLYARLGVRYYWTFDSTRRAVTEHVLDQNGAYVTRTTRAPEAFRSECFPDVEINLSRIFA